MIPYLPPHAPEFRSRWPGDPGGFNAEQMYAFYKLGVEAERKRCISICKVMADRMESAAQTALNNKEEDEVSPLSSTARQLTVAALHMTNDKPN